MPKLNYLLTDTGTVVGIVAADTLTVAGGALLLWNGGGQTVADAPWQTYAIVIIGTAALVAGRTLLLRRHSPQGRLTANPLPAIAVTIELIAAALLGAWWITTGAYVVGWVLTYGCGMLLVSGIFDIFTGISHRIRLTTRPTSLLRDGVFVLEAVAGIIGAFVTAPIHQWRLPVLDTTLLTIATGVAAGMALAWLLTSTTSQASAEPETHISPTPTLRRDLIGRATHR